MAGPVQSDFYRGRLVAVTGGAGFLASHLIDVLRDLGASVRALGRRPAEACSLPRDVAYVQADLRDRAAAERAMGGAELVFHLAAVGWGFHANLRRQPELLTENVLLNTTVLDAAFRAGARGFLYTSSSAVYPAHLQVLEEEAPWDAPPHPQEACFGWAKRLGEIQARAYHAHYGLPVAVVRPTNPYGPGDDFDAERGHVIPALIRRALAGEDPLVVWGTGEPIRSFIHARDVARGMTLALERYAGAEPVNLGGPEPATVGELARLVLDLAGREETRLEFDRSKPDGPARRVASGRRAAECLGFEAAISMREGIAETIRWYRQSGR